MTGGPVINQAAWSLGMPWVSPGRYPPMSDIKIASRAHAVKHFAPGEVYVRTLQEAFEAGAAWQREQDAKIAENYSEHAASQDLSGGYACEVVANTIRAQDAKQETNLPEIPDSSVSNQEGNKCGLCMPDKPCNMAACPNDVDAHQENSK